MHTYMYIYTSLHIFIYEGEGEVAQSCPTPSDPMDCSLPGSSVHGIFQARVLEWGVMAFSEIFHLVPHKKIYLFPY